MSGLPKNREEYTQLRGQSMVDTGQTLVLSPTEDNMLSPVSANFIVGFMTSYEFDIKEFLARYIRDQDIGGEKLLLAYPCLITQLCLAIGVQELLDINKMIESTNTTDLGLIRDTTNLLSRQARRGADMLAEIYRQSSQTEASETTDVAEVVGQTETIQTLDAVGTSGATPPV